MAECPYSLMDRTAVSGTASTGSIPVGGARRSYPFVLLQTGPRVLRTLRNLQHEWVFTCQNLPEHGSDLVIFAEDSNEPPPNDAIWYAKVRLSYAFLLLSEK